MGQVIRLKESLYQRLSIHSKGFETPSEVIDRIVSFYEKENNIEIDIESFVREKPTSLKVIYHPVNDEIAFKKQLINDRVAYIKLHKVDGTSEIKQWSAYRFTKSSNVRRNLNSGYLRNWKEKGIFKAELSTNKEHLS